MLKLTSVFAGYKHLVSVVFSFPQPQKFCSAQFFSTETKCCT